MQVPLRVVDPILTNAYITRNHGYMVLDTLFALDAAGKPQPEMVESWQESVDRLTVTLTLRKGLTFHDGTPVTGEDVVASLKRRGQRDVLGLAPDGRYPQPGKPRRQHGHIPPEAAVRHADRSAGQTGLARALHHAQPHRGGAGLQPITEVIGSGPYKFVAADFQPGVKATYVKFTGYVPRAELASGFAGGKVAIADRIELVSISDSQTAVNASNT